MGEEGFALGISFINASVKPSGAVFRQQPNRFLQPLAETISYVCYSCFVNFRVLALDHPAPARRESAHHHTSRPFACLPTTHYHPHPVTVIHLLLHLPYRPQRNRRIYVRQRRQYHLYQYVPTPFHHLHL